MFQRTNVALCLFRKKCCTTIIVPAIRRYSSKTYTKYFTTPIYYVNADPHIGHLYSSVIADASQRWHNLLNYNAQFKFSTGTDEHGSKIQQAAKAHNTSINDYCDRISSKYRQMSDVFQVNCTDFIRTSDHGHKSTVQSFWCRLKERDFIYKSTYKGWYCVPDETFLSDSQLEEIVKNGETLLVSAESGHPVEWSEEDNYIFKLSSFKEDLLYWLKQNEKAVIPHKFYKILFDMLHSEEALSDISVSRPSSRVHWGIPVPNDPDQTIYVWLDALVNYLTAAGFSQEIERGLSVWPPDVQVIGKDILKFHGIYWPAFLMAAGLEPPRTILCHSHWTVNSEKMSKSKGNVVDPLEKANVFTSDGLRYFLLREGVNHSDGNYSDTKMLRILNSELADTLGNLLSRCCGKALNSRQIFPNMKKEIFNQISCMEESQKLLENLENLPDICQKHYDEFNFYKAAEAIMSTLRSANLFFETLKPWELKKHHNTLDNLDVTLHVAMETLRVTGILLQPLVPNISQNLLNKISVSPNERYFEHTKQLSWNSDDFESKPLSSDTSLLFRRIIVEDNVKKSNKGSIKL